MLSANYKRLISDRIQLLVQVKLTDLSNLVLVVVLMVERYQPNP